MLATPRPESSGGAAALEPLRFRLYEELLSLIEVEARLAISPSDVIL